MCRLRRPEVEYTLEEAMELLAEGGYALVKKRGKWLVHNMDRYWEQDDEEFETWEDAATKYIRPIIRQKGGQGA